MLKSLTRTRTTRIISLLLELVLCIRGLGLEVKNKTMYKSNLYEIGCSSFCLK